MALSLLRPRTALLALIAALVVALAAASGARAELVKARGQTTVTLSDTVRQSLAQDGVSVYPLAPAEGANGSFTFPLVAGFRDSRSYNGIFAHDGGLKLRRGDQSAWFRRVVVVRLGSSSVVLAQVRGSGRDCPELSGAQRRLAPDTPSEARLTVRASNRVCKEGRVVVLARLVNRSKSIGSDAAKLSADLELTSEAADLINGVAGTRVVKSGGLLGSTTTTVCATSPCTAESKTTVGILLPLITTVIGAKEVIAEARALGLKTVRTSQDVSNPEVRPAILTYQREGMNVQLGVNNDPQPGPNASRPSRPPVTAAELATYKERLAKILDAISPPTLVNVENEENSTRFFSGTMSQYLAELDAATEVAHARGLKVTNGGITSTPAALLTWQDYEDRGLDAQADDFASRAFAAPRNAAILRDLRKKPFTGFSRKALQEAWDKSKELIAGFRRNAMDYVNFHWYIDDDRALSEVVSYLRRATGKPVVTNEIGQYSDDPSVVTGHLKTLVTDLRLPFVLWFDASTIPAIGLHSDPGVLQPNGEAFKAFVAGNPTLLK